MEQQRTADGEPLKDNGTAETGRSGDASSGDTRSDDLQGDDDFEQTNAQTPPRTL